MLDICETLIIEDIRSIILTDRQIIGVAQILGSKDLELPNPDEEIRKFKIWLDSPPPTQRKESRDRVILLKALGLRS
jgi:hypothetical protein